MAGRDRSQLATPTLSPVQLHPQLSEIYRCKVEELSGTLADPEIRPMALETMRGLIQSVGVHETADGMPISCFPRAIKEQACGSCERPHEQA